MAQAVTYHTGVTEVTWPITNDNDLMETTHDEDACPNHPHLLPCISHIPHVLVHLMCSWTATSYAARQLPHDCEPMLPAMYCCNVLPVH